MAPDRLPIVMEKDLDGGPVTPYGPAPPSGNPEVISLNSASDFKNNLINNQWLQYPNPNGGLTGYFDFCTVNVDLHVTYLYDYPCDNDLTNYVLGSMVGYLMPAVTP